MIRVKIRVQDEPIKKRGIWDSGGHGIEDRHRRHKSRKTAIEGWKRKTGEPPPLLEVCQVLNSECLAIPTVCERNGTRNGAPKQVAPFLVSGRFAVVENRRRGIDATQRLG